MGIAVEIWGGPYDGRVYAVESIHYPLRFAKPNLIHLSLAEPAIPGPAMHILELRVVLTPSGWKALWPKGES